MLTLPIKLTRSQTKFIKDNNLICIGKGNPDSLFLFAVEAHIIDLSKNVVIIEKPPFKMAGGETDYLYFVTPETAKAISRVENSYVLIKYKRPSAPKIVAPPPPPPATMNDVFDAFCAYAKKDGNSMHYLRIFDDKSGGVYNYDGKEKFSFCFERGFAGIVETIKSATK